MQNSTVNLVGGSLTFSNLDFATLGGLAGNQNVTLANGSSAALALTVGGNNQDTLFSGNLNGSGNLTKTGTGNLTLSGNNLYTGNTTVSAGNLVVSNLGAASASGSGVMTVAPGAALIGNGGVAANTIINGTLSPGSPGTVGLLSFAQNLTLNANAALNVLFAGNTRGSLYSAITVGSNLSLGGTLAVSLINSFAPTWGMTFDLFQVAGSLSGTFTSVLLPALNANLRWNTTQLYTTGDIAVQTANLSQWAAANNLSGNDALAAAKPFGGAPNVIRYAMNLDTSSSPGGAPTLSTQTNAGTNFLTIQYRIRKGMTDYQLVPQYSPDLVTWTNVDAGNITQLTDDDLYTARYQASAILPTDGSVFLRVVAEPVP